MAEPWPGGRRSLAMNAPRPVTDNRLVDEAFAIAWNFVKQSGRAADNYYAQVFLSREVMRLMGRGETNKIRIANLAIAAFEREGQLSRSA
jgi:hypothetical protein